MKNSDLGMESSKSERESKIQISVSTYLLSIFIAGIIFFAVGNRSRSVPVPSILKSDRASLVSKEASFKLRETPIVHTLLKMNTKSSIVTYRVNIVVLVLKLAKKVIPWKL